MNTDNTQVDEVNKSSYLSTVGRTIGTAVKRNESLLTGAAIGIVGTSLAFGIYGKIKNKSKEKKKRKKKRKNKKKNKLKNKDEYKEVEQEKKLYKVTLQSKDGKSIKRNVEAISSEEAKQIVIKSLIENFEITDVSLV